MTETATYTYKEHLIEKQRKAEEAMLEEFHLGDYTLDNPLVKYNAYLINPLSAVVLFKTEEPTAITVRVLGKTEEADIFQTFPVGTEHVLPIVGLYPEYENKVEIYPYQTPSKKHTVTIPVGEVEGTDLVNSIETTPEYMQDNIMFLCPANYALAIAVDYAGDVRLKLDVPMVWDVKVLDNGHLLMSSDRLTSMPYFMSGMYEFSAVGKIYTEYRVPTGFHHDCCVLPNGDIIALTCNHENSTVEDQLVVVDKDTGVVKRTINYIDFLKPGAQKSGSWSEEDWFHNNAVWYDEHTNSLTLSGRHVNAMVNIDFDTEEINWIISDPDGWPEEYHKYLFTPVGDGEFDWQYEQHANLITPDGDVMCFDNHHYGAQDPDKYLTPEESYSRGVRYKIDTETMEIEQVWQYGKERGYEFFSPYICNVVYYNEDHYLIHSGGIAYDGQGNPSKELGPFAMQEDPDAKLESITVEWNHGVKEYELSVRSNYYRAEKFPLYSKKGGEYDLQLGAGRVLGYLGETAQMDYDIPAEEVNEPVPEKVDVRLTDEEDMFTFEAMFEKGQLVMLVLEGEEDTRRYFISTAKGHRGAMCAGTFLPKDDRETRTVVTKYGFDKGDYKVKLIIDDKKYDTGLTIKG
ncbi:aryl-sulfate sulfotransferase [Aerococcus tenax]|uniref:aryl-sulfate sulfotransferase n=2 Tax=Aerococcaceae TaxID=186827 RepID=UPI0018A6DA3D|nr:aryl-sulfate sulfotransferase [Aerococcus tenax]